MLKKMKLRTRMVVLIGSVAALAFVATIVIVSVLLSRTVKREGLNRIDELACHHAERVKCELMEGLSVARTLSKAMEGVLEDRSNIDRKMLDRILARTVDSNTLFSGAWVMIEPDKFDGREQEFAGKDGQSESGIYSPYAYRKDGKICLVQSNWDDDKTKDYYRIPMETGRENIIDPYLDAETKVVMTTVCVPVKEDGKPVGVAGIDIQLTSFDEMISQIKPWETGYAFLVSNEGTFVAHPKKAVLGKKLSDVGSPETTLAAVREGRETDEVKKSTATGLTSYVKFVPIELGETQTPWSFATSISMDRMLADSRTIRNLMIVIGSVSLAALLICIALVVRGITGPIMRIVEQLNSGADQVASASGQVSAASQTAAQGASEQASSLEETSAALEEMASMGKANVENTDKATSLMGDAGRIVGEAEQMVGQTAGAMEEINEASGKIANIIKVIEEIAFQTNLLALNAAVEAARAGEHGKGFAVVADEVRTLAQRSAQAANETSQLIENTIECVKKGSELNADLVEHFGEVTNSAGQVGGLIEEISSATQEQAKGIDQVNSAMGQMDQVVQQSAAGAEESASASEELSSQAQVLRQTVEQLASLVGGSRKNRAPVSTSHCESQTIAVPTPERSEAETPKQDDDLTSF